VVEIGFSSKGQGKKLTNIVLGGEVTSVKPLGGDTLAPTFPGAVIETERPAKR